jgi:hypothetical protein
LRELFNERNDILKRSEAIAIIDDLLPGPKYQHPPPATLETVQKDNEFFTVRNISKIAKSLDFSAAPRLSRTGNQKIPILESDSNHFFLDEEVRTLIMYLYKEVVSRVSSDLSRGQQDKILEDAATIVMYDLGYKEPRRYKNILKVWEPRMFQYFKTGIISKYPSGRTNASQAKEKEEEPKMMEGEELCPCGCKQTVKKGQFFAEDSLYEKDVASNGLSALRILRRKDFYGE